MAEKKSIHEFTTGTPQAQTAFVVDTPNASAESGYVTEKVITSDLGNTLLGTLNYTQSLDTESKNIFGAVNELNENKANTADLAQVATSGNYSDLNGKPDQPEYIATKVSTPDSSGKVTLSFAELNCTARPSVVMAMPQSYRGVATYSFDDSASSVILYFNNMDGSVHTGATRYSIVVYQ